MEPPSPTEPQPQQLTAHRYRRSSSLKALLC